MNKLISVIVPVYNTEQYIHKCLDSIINQTYTNLEIILVDDGSTDNSGLICDEYAKKDSRIQVIHKKNGGLADARNAGIDICQGEYISFIDSDDWVSEDMIEVLLKNAEEHDADMSICQYRKVYNRDNVSVKNSSEVLTFDNKQGIEHFYRKRTFECHACEKLYRKCLFENIRYPKGKIYEDEFTTYKLLWNSKKIVYTDKECYFYYIRSDSLSHDKFNIAQLDKLDGYEGAKTLFEQEMPDIVPFIKYRWLDGYIAFMRDMYRANVKSKELTELHDKAVEYSKGYLKCKYIKLIYKLSWLAIRCGLFELLVKVFKL